MQGLGFLLIMWGALDWGMSTSGTDVYYDWLGITVPDSVYTFTPWIRDKAAGHQRKVERGAGAVLLRCLDYFRP